MTDLLLIAPMGAVLLLGLFYVRRREGAESLRLWFWAFASLYAAALLTASAAVPANRFLHAASNVFMVAFIGLMLMGAFTFAERAVPRWLLPAFVGFALARALPTLAGAPVYSYAVGLVFGPPALAAAGWLVYTTAKQRHGAPTELWLGPSFGVIGLVNAIDMSIRATGGDPSWLAGYWASVGAAAALLLVLAVYEWTRDQAQRRAAELEEERRTLQAVIETAPLAIFLHDDAGRLLMFNRMAAGPLGFDHASSIHIPIAGNVEQATVDHHIASNHFDGLQRDLLENPNLVVEDLEVEVGEDERRTLQLFSSPVLSETGERFGRVWIARDLTDERDLQAQLAQAQKMETLGTLAGGIAHDFNNQLTTILGNAELTRDAVADSNPEVDGALRDLERAAEHCAELTRGLLAFARRAPLERRSTAVAPVMNEVENLLRASVPSSISLSIEVDAATWPVLADATQLQQVLLNLAVNARDAIPDKGKIEMRARNRVFGADGAEGQSSPLGGRHVEFEVFDNGVGIEEDVRARMFDPFFSTKEVGSGTGLGLSIVYGIVHSHDGWLEVESRRGYGTAIRFYLPAAERVAEAVAVEDEAPSLDGSETILIADDDPLVRRLTRTLLERLGYRVIEACDGEEAVLQFRKHRASVKLAVLDLTMPRMGGLEALEQIRAIAPDLSCIIASGFIDGQEPVRAAAEQTPEVRLLPKPFSPSALGRAVRSALDAGP